MRKIPTVFKRDPDDMKRVLPEVTSGCEWVLAGEGEATRKYDGTCVLIKRDGLAVHAFARREVKDGKPFPPHFQIADSDPVTGKTVGWEPAEQSGFAKFIAEALVDFNGPPGTYELIGPKINGDPEGCAEAGLGHMLVEHASAESVLDTDRSYEGLRALLTGDDWPGYEGIVFHHPDGRMAKIKVRDFR
jgi:hypothetical protein